MKIKQDENMPNALTILFRSKGHDIATVQEENLVGADDSVLLKEAASEGRILMTFDIDFADIRNYPPKSHAGIIVFRLQDQRWTALKKAVQLLIDSGILDRLQQGLAIVDETRIRIRAGKEKGVT